MKNAIVDILMSRLLLAAAQNYLFATIFSLILTSSHFVCCCYVFCLVCILLRFLMYFLNLFHVKSSLKGWALGIPLATFPVCK